MRRLILAAIAASFVVQSTSFSQAEARLSTGSMVGIGVAAAAVGVIVGATIADQLSDEDQSAMNENYSRVYDARVGEPIEWRGNTCSGRMTVVRTGYWSKAPTTKCREVRNTVYDAQGAEIDNQVRTTCYRDNQWVWVEGNEMIEGSYAAPQPPPYVGPRAGPRVQLGSGWMSWDILEGKYLNFIRDPRTSDDERLDTVDRIEDHLRDHRVRLSGRQLFEILAPIRNEEQKFEALKILVKISRYRASEIVEISSLFGRCRVAAVRILRDRAH